MDILNAVTDRDKARRMRHRARYKRVKARADILVDRKHYPHPDSVEDPLSDEEEAELRELCDAIGRLCGTANPLDKVLTDTWEDGDDEDAGP